MWPRPGLQLRNIASSSGQRELCILGQLVIFFVPSGLSRPAITRDPCDPTRIGLHCSV
jgi:hypothetical protein